MDERKESGEFYPGGRASQGGGGSGGEGGDTAPKVPVTHVDELPERYREGEMRAKINEIARIVSGGVAALAAMVAAAQVTVQGARKDALWNDDFVVTNVTVALNSLVTTNQLEEARRSDGEALLQEIAEAADETRRTLISELEVATNELRTRVIGEIAGATNAAAADRDAKLEGYATKTWVQGQGFADGSALEGYATQGWVTEQGYAPKSWVEGRGYMTGTNLAPYATKDWVEGRGYMTGTNLAPYATKDWVEGKGYVTGDEAREGIEKGAEEAVRRIAAEMDGTTAHRLMVPGAWEWIDGTGAIWRVCSAVEWRGETLTGDMGATNWIGQGWSIGWEPGDENAEIGTWRMRNVLSAAGPLEVEWIGEELPYGEGKWRLLADKVELNGVMVTPGQITENGWYQIADENGWLHFVSPLVTTVTVARVTNAVDRLARLEELSPPTSLAPATNYTDSATNELNTSISYKLHDVAEAATNYADSATENLRMEYSDGTIRVRYATALSDRDTEEIRTADEIFAQLDAATTTNDVCNIVTNEVLELTEWAFSGDLDASATYYVDMEVYEINGLWSCRAVIWGSTPTHSEKYRVSNIIIENVTHEVAIQAAENTMDVSGTIYDMYDDVDVGFMTATRRRITRNALGLARLVDLPTNHVTRAEMEEAIDAIPEVDLSRLATKSEFAAVSNESALVTRLYTSSNVILEVTNYNSAVHSPKLRLLQLDESNTYHTVWAETNNLARTLAAATGYTDGAVANAERRAASTYAPRAWSGVTSGLGVEAPSNTTWISTPTTVIAGGLEYTKVVHSGGAIWVLSGNGMMQFDPTTNAYLRISADDGTEILSIEKTDAVTVGAYADGIAVYDDYELKVIVIPVNVVSAEHPTMYYRRSLNDAVGWRSETELASEYGQGTVEWIGPSGGWLCRIFLPQSIANQGFFKFTYKQPGSTLVRHGAPVDVSGGIMCTDGIHKVRPVYSNGAVTWEVMQ